MVDNPNGFAALADVAIRTLEQASVQIAATQSTTNSLDAGVHHEYAHRAAVAVGDAIRYLAKAAHPLAVEQGRGSNGAGPR